MRTLILIALFSSSLLARLEWPNANPEGGFCGFNYRADPFACPEGFVCDLTAFPKYGHGVCRRPEDVLPSSADAPKQENTPRN